MRQIKQVEHKKDLAAFIDFPHHLYEGDPCYVPELHIAQRDLLTPGKHPFHDHAEVCLFLAYEEGVIKGRIAAIFNKNHNEFKKASDGFFGFFDLVNDNGLAAEMLETAAAWLRTKGATRMIGPVNPSTNEPCGLLVDGFNTPPVVMMTYNKPYYATLLEQAGFHKQVDMLAYHLSTATVDKRTIALKNSLLERLAKRGIVIRSINLKDFASEVDKVLEVYNDAWAENTGFVPMTRKEFKYLAKDLKMILDKDFCQLAEHNGKVIGFSLSVPDLNQVLIKIKRGRLLPTGIFKLLLGLKKIDFVRVLALGVVPEYRKAGIEACFYAEIIEKAASKKMRGGEASWILENNELMNNGLKKLNAEPYKRYRLYEKQL
jgi:GNAT superfamily N-acetyltransferase